MEKQALSNIEDVILDKFAAMDKVLTEATRVARDSLECDQLTHKVLSDLISSIEHNSSKRV